MTDPGDTKEKGKMYEAVKVTFEIPATWDPEMRAFEIIPRLLKQCSYQ